MRIVGREHQDLVSAHQVDELQPLVGRDVLGRLGREAQPLADMRARQLLDPRHLDASLPVLAVEPPHDVRQPGKAALEHHEAQARELVEDAVADQADHLRHQAHRDQRVPLHIGQPHAIGPLHLRRVVEGDLQVVACGGGEDRPVLRLAIGDVADDGQQNLAHLWVRGHAVDLTRRRLRIAGEDLDRADQPVVAGQPVLGAVVVVGGGQRVAEAVLQLKHGRIEVAGEDRMRDVVRLEDVPAHRVEIGRRGRAVARGDVRAVAVSRRRIAEGLGKAPPRALGDPPRPGLGQIRDQVREACEVLVDVGVDDRHRALLRGCTRAR